MQFCYKTFIWLLLYVTHWSKFLMESPLEMELNQLNLHIDFVFL